MNKDIIRLIIPKKLDYISLVRLTTSGIACNMGLTIDEIEDIKVSIGEACINALALSNTEEISLLFQIEEKKFRIRVSDVKEDIPMGSPESKEMELGLMIVKSLMDEVKFDQFGIEMVKYIEDDDQ